MKRKNRRVALFVGVDEYNDPSIPSLSGAVADAKSLYDFFASCPNQFDEAEKMVNPTSDQLLEKVQALSADLSKGDFFLFYFAGHGMADGGKQKLLCANTRRGKRSLTNTFELDEVAGPEKWNVAVILDACRTPLDRMRGFEARVADKRDLAFYDALVKSRNDNDASLSILFSCDEGRTAGEVRGHGLFTLALLDVLKQAQQDHRGWRFDQNLGEEIGRTMRQLADSDSGQRPWIKASGTPPLFFLPNKDLAPLLAFVDDLRQDSLLSVDESAECQKAVGGSSSFPCAKGIFETIGFFSNWEEERQKESTPKDVAATMLKAYYGAAMAGGGATPAAAPAVTAAPEDEAPCESSRPLPEEVVKRLRGAAEGITDEWRGRKPMEKAREAMLNARTEHDALASLREAERTLQDEFVHKNNQDANGMDVLPLRRLAPLFSSREWNVLWRELPDESQCQCETDRALLNLFRLATTLCLIRKN